MKAVAVYLNDCQVNHSSTTILTAASSRVSPLATGSLSQASSLPFIIRPVQAMSDVSAPSTRQCFRAVLLCQGSLGSAAAGHSLV